MRARQLLDQGDYSAARAVLALSGRDDDLAFAGALFVVQIGRRLGVGRKPRGPRG